MTPKFLYCYECGSRMEVVNGEEIEPCWNCLKRAQQDARAELLGKSRVQRQTEEKLSEKLEEVRREYQINDAREIGMEATDHQNVSAEAENIDTTENGSGVDHRRLVRCVEDLMYAARRVRNKYGRGKNDTLLDWTEWADLYDAANAIEEILSANA